MGIWRALRLLVVTLIAASTSAVAGPLVEQPYRVAYGDRLTTQIYLNGQGPYEFLLDTASSRTVLYEHTRAALGLVPVSQERIKVFTTSGVTEALPYELKQLGLSGTAIDNLKVITIADPVNATDEPDGILGIDVLQNYLVVLDRPVERLRLYTPDTPVPAPFTKGNSALLEARALPGIGSQFWFFHAFIQYKMAPALLDLGAGLTIINWRYALFMGFSQTGFPGPPEELRDAVGKRTPVIKATNMAIDFAGRRWSRQDVLIADAKLFSLLGLADTQASIIGPGLLKDDSIAIDFRNHRLYVAPRH